MRLGVAGLTVLLLLAFFLLNENLGKESKKLDNTNHHLSICCYNMATRIEIGNDTVPT